MSEDNVESATTLSLESSAPPDVGASGSASALSGFRLLTGAKVSAGAPDYSYQPPLVAAVLEHLAAGKGCVLAATPGAGKTNMAIDVIADFASRGERVLVLTHGQRILREQFHRRLQTTGAAFTYAILDGGGAGSADALVHVALPQWGGFRRGAGGGYGLIVVDEAHHFYTAAMVQGLLAKNPGAKVLLLTGTPSSFVKSQEFPIVFVSIQELLQHNVLTDPYIEIVQTKLPLTLADFNATGDLAEGVAFAQKQITSALDAVMAALVKRLRSRARHPKTHNGWLKRGLLWEKMLGVLEKTMVIAHDQEQARQVAAYFQRAGVAVALSTSDDDTDSAEVARFTSDPEVRCLQSCASEASCFSTWPTAAKHH